MEACFVKERCTCGVERRPSNVLQVLQSATGVKVVDEPSANQYPMPLTATGEYDVEVGGARDWVSVPPPGRGFL